MNYLPGLQIYFRARSVVACRMLHVACCMLHVAFCMLHVACCMLHVACLKFECKLCCEINSKMLLVACGGKKPPNVEVNVRVLL